MFKAQLYTNGSNSRDTFTSNDFFLVFKGASTYTAGHVSLYSKF